jgi:phospholipase C
LNPAGEPFFRGSDDTPSVNGLGTLTNGDPDGIVLTDNPNANNDSDGWYDHQMSPIVNSSAVLNSASPGNGDQLNAPGKCGNGTPLEGIQGRCGYGPRQPLLVISPFAKTNFVDHTLTDQSSVLRLIEKNWGTGQIGGGSYDQLAGPL